MASEGQAGFSVGITLAAVLLALGYLRGWYYVRAAHPDVASAGRLASFLIGVFLLWLAVGSPMAAWDHQLLTFHMVQHLMIMTLAAPLILMGAPLILMGAPPPGSLGWFVRRDFAGGSFLKRIGAVLTHPVFCWVASTSTVIGWHVPVLFEMGMQSAGWHVVEQATFFVAGLLFWWPVLRGWRGRSGEARWPVPLYLFLATLPCDALSAFLTFCNRVVYPHYLNADRPFSLSALGDQECAGALMWVFVTFAYLVPAAMVTMQMLSPRAQEGAPLMGLESGVK